MPESVGLAWAELGKQDIVPRGVAFWVRLQAIFEICSYFSFTSLRAHSMFEVRQQDISDEGDVPPSQKSPLYLATGLNAFLNTRP